MFLSVGAGHLRSLREAVARVDVKLALPAAAGVDEHARDDGRGDQLLIAARFDRGVADGEGSAPLLHRDDHCEGVVGYRPFPFPARSESLSL